MTDSHRRLKQGEIRVLGEAAKKFAWHNPRTIVRPVQWQPETGVTRYQWARDRTPKNQVPFWEHLQRIYQTNTPTLLPPEIAHELSTLPGDLSEPEIEGFRETIAEHEIHSRDPSGEWCFMINAESWRGVLCDRLVVYCYDRWTLPDPELLMRFRSWVLDDARDAFQWYPGQEYPSAPDSLALRRYDNRLWNSAHLISPRLDQSGHPLAL